MPFALFNYSSLSYIVLALSPEERMYQTNIWILHDFQGPTIKFKDFPGFPWPVRTLFYAVKQQFLKSNLYALSKETVIIWNSSQSFLSSRENLKWKVFWKTPG